MECLGIPVDHSLIRIIENIKCPPHNIGSPHLDILNTLAESVEVDGKSIPAEESHHAPELASPDTRGGVLVALLRPPRNQRFDHGYTAEIARCRTTNAVASLIYTATNRRLTIDGVSVFDTMPHLPEGSDDNELVRNAENTFSRMVEPKSPDVVISCYQGKSPNYIVKNLASIGVGGVFNAPGFKISSDLEVRRINTFHPSYAVNYQATYSCFRRLLLLQFTQAFYHWSGEWQEEPWMESLR